MALEQASTKKTKLRQGRRSRVDPFEAYADPSRNGWNQKQMWAARSYWTGLIAMDPERYGPQHKRKLQRRIRDWRVAGCRRAWRAKNSGQKASRGGE